MRARVSALVMRLRIGLQSGTILGSAGRAWIRVAEISETEINVNVGCQTYGQRSSMRRWIEFLDDQRRAR